MKKLFVFALIAVMSLGLVARGGKDNADADTNSNTPEAVTAESEDATPEETAALEETTAPKEDAAGETKEVTINLMGNDVPATVTITDGTFEASYSFNGNDVVAKGSVSEDGTMTVEEYTPDTIPAEYVQAAVTSIADEL